MSALDAQKIKAPIHHWIHRYRDVRRRSVSLCEPLATEDYVVQPSPEVSPPKWHLAHTTWLWEELILVPYFKGYRRYQEGYRHLFNSYYKSAGPHWVQAERGQLSRPRVEDICAYRQYVDEAIERWFMQSDVSESQLSLVEIGLQHEQQHQELLLMDIKVIFGQNPSLPSYLDIAIENTVKPQPDWDVFAEGIYTVGHSSNEFAYDHESPKHKVYLHPFCIKKALVTNEEYLAFIQAGGYQQPQYWLSKGWDWVQNNDIQQPLYWYFDDNQWMEFTLHGLKPLLLDAPVLHLSYFEADAFAKWFDARLPTEFEYESYLNQAGSNVSPVSSCLHPYDVNQPYGQVWCWTSSHFSAYPNFKPLSGMLGEYNGKFMCNQFVLRGSSIVTPPGHYRPTYRNFFEPHQRWMFSGLRLAKGISA